MAIGTAAALIGSAALTAGGSYLSSRGANKAAQIQADAAQRGYDQQLAFAREAQQYHKPYTDVGKGAIYTLADLYGISTDGNPNATPYGEQSVQAFRNSPDYDFAFREGNRALTFSNAAQGMLRSGNHLRDLTQYGQGLATQNFNNYAQRLMSLANLGRGAASQASGQGIQVGNNLATSLGNQGQALASGVVGSTNAWNQGLSTAGNNLAFYGAMQQRPNWGAYDPDWTNTTIQNA